jgi:hypothetical protein
MEQYEDINPKNYINKDPYQGPLHGFLTQTTPADVLLYDMMLNEAE